MRDWHLQPAVLHQLVRAQLSRTPDGLAAVYDHELLTNQELLLQSDAWSARLAALGVKRGSLVGIHLDRSLQLPGIILGILQAGGACVPLEPSHPRPALATMIAEARPQLILSHTELSDRLPPNAVAVVRIDELPPATSSPSAERVSETDLAFVFYTSGSTGVPKGVMLPHKAVAARMWRPEDEIAPLGHCMTILKTAISHSPFLGEMFTPLLHSCYFAIARPGGYQDVSYLGDLINQHHITHIAMTSSVLRTFVEWPGSADCRSLKAVYCGGELVTDELRQKFHDRFRDARFYVTYGTSEAGHVLSGEYGASDRLEASRIGRPIPQATVHLLDDSLKPVPAGEIGEMFFTGPRLASGYLHRPDWTAECFLEAPAGKTGRRMFRSGDLARLRPDDEFEFHGRIDEQVKILGHRVELREIEAALASHPDVAAAAVVARANDRGGTQLAGYVVAKAQREFTSSAIREWLADRLPHHMVPQHVMKLSELPLTPIGKVDRATLPEPTRDASKRSSESADGPRDDAESLVVSVFQRLLEVERVGIRDDFFALGGHSLLAVEAVLEINRLNNSNLGVGDLIRNPTVENLADVLRGAERHVGPSVVPLAEASGRENLFCIMGIQLYHDLAQALREEFSVYGVLVPIETEAMEQFASGRRDAEFPTVEELAGEYVSVIREAQATGPYNLIGLSFGGLVAFEIARQLQEAGESTNFIGLLDCALPNGKRRKKLRWLQRRARDIARLPRTVVQRLRHGPGFSRKAKQHHWRARANDAWRKGRAEWSGKHYRYRGSITLFRAPGDEYYDEYIYSPDYGWQDFVIGRVITFDITGDHTSIVRPPHVQHLARLILDGIRKSVDHPPLTPA
jgi:amino acid adenylation domain-containing protein